MVEVEDLCDTKSDILVDVKTEIEKQNCKEPRSSIKF